MAPLDQLRIDSSTIARICVRYHVAELSVFGSTARGTAGPESDIDPLVAFKPDVAIGLAGFNRLRRELEDSPGRRVDFVSKDGLKPVVRDEVLADAQVVYAA